MTRRPWYQSPGLLLLCAVVLTLGIVTVESVVATAVVLQDGGLVALPFVAAAMIGVAVCRHWLLKSWDVSAQLVLGSALGVGLLPVAVLIVGCVGIPSPMATFGIVGAFLLIGLITFVNQSKQYSNAMDAVSVTYWHWMWLFACPFVALILLANALPPGILWVEEAYAYDALEYHLAVPKVFFEQGHISFMGNNVYSNFPLGYEMLALLMMAMKGDALGAAFMCQLVNAPLALLFIASAWLAGRQFSSVAGVVAGVLAAVTPWTMYLAGIAFVEIGMLALGMAALTATIIAIREPGRADRGAIVAGALAGLAAGFKYTALPMIALPIALLYVLGNFPLRRRLLCSGISVVCAIIACSPWMIRNTINTGNPVFPLAYAVFGANDDVWSAEQAAQWNAAHRKSETESSVSDTLRLGIHRTLGDARLGWPLFVLATIGAATRRDRFSAAMFGMLALQVGLWLFATHLFARFAIVFMLPLIVLAARCGQGGKTINAKRILACALGLLSVWNLYHLGGLYYDHTRYRGEPLQAYGVARISDPIIALNELGEGANVLLVGEARTFELTVPCEYAVVFNRHPLADAAQTLNDPQAIIGWLRERGTTHVYVNWSEMARLRRTYGFYPEVTPAMFEQLQEHELTPVREFKAGPQSSPYATLFAVPMTEKNATF